MTDLRPTPARPADPIGAAEAVATLLRTGRTTMALTLLEDLPDLIRAGLEAAKPPPPSPTALQLAEAELTRVRAHVRALVAETDRLRAQLRQAEADLASRRREAAKLDAEIAKRRRLLELLERGPKPPAAPPAPKPHELLAQALGTGRTTPERVAEVLRLRPADVPPIADGRVGLAATAWRKLLRELGHA